MKRLLLLVPTVLFAACGSSGGPTARDASKPLMYVSSQRSASYVANCLEGRLSRVNRTMAGATTELAVGSSSNTSYFVTLMPSQIGSIIKVMRPADAPDDPPEPEMRFDIARCAV
ncbi:sugar ABC transporter ATPase [Paraburkholderia sp.]|uniref:sugar ABC transporter ATPase n=1 Tax=Paraburkholderia sp. TaxID=1926495 RepID=UPI002383B607|nr:sugar ABC transporter ATPase [Paraburkholderia sp.]MDE1182242.1 sugar ABC transporter ATPase [Paraburkholderia sp.]